MGNQQSSRRDKPGADSVAIERESYRSFDRSDTRESTRSLRNSLRSKMPGTAKSDSPRASLSTLHSNVDALDRSDAASTRSGTRSPRRAPIPASSGRFATRTAR